MKKIISILLVLIMMVSVFSGCSEAEKPEDNNIQEGESGIIVEPLQKSFTAVIYDSGEDEDFWKAVKSAFESANQGITVNMIVSKDAAYEVRDRILGGNSPDFVYLPSSEESGVTEAIYDSGEDEDFWKAVKSAFESANQGITVNMIVSKDAAYEVRDRILGGNSPDFVYLPSSEESGVTEALIKDKALLDLSTVETSAPEGAFENNSCKPYEDEISYLAPLFTETEGLIYNKETLSKNGFSVPQTWNDFIAIAKACENKNIKFFTYAGAEPDEYVNIFAAALAPAIGVEETNKILGCEEEAWKNENIKIFVEKIEEVTKLVVSGSSTKSKEDTMNLLKEGKAVFVSGSSSDLEELNKDGEKYAICNYPSLSGTSAKTVSFTEMYIPVEAKEAELAKQFMTFLYSETSVSLAEEKLGKEIPAAGETVIAPEFAVKSSANPTLSDEFCELIVDVYKGNVSSKNFAEKMLEYIKEY